MEGNKDSSYLFPQVEKHLVHARIQNGGFDATTGKRTSTAYEQKFTVAEFNQAEKSRSFSGRDVIILHDPEYVGESDKDSDESIIEATLSGKNEDKVKASNPLEAARTMYATLAGKEAPKSWNSVKLSNEIKNAQQALIDAGNPDPLSSKSTKTVAEHEEDEDGAGEEETDETDESTSTGE